MTKLDNAISETVNGYKRTLIMRPPYDKSSSDPKKNYGIHGLEMVFILGDGKRGMQFVVYTCMHLPHVADNLFNNHFGGRYNPFTCQGADVGYHSPTPMYEGQSAMQSDCHVTGGTCYYDGSGLRAEEWYEQWIVYGNDWVWKKLEEAFEDQFSTPVAPLDTSDGEK